MLCLSSFLFNTLNNNFVLELNFIQHIKQHAMNLMWITLLVSKLSNGYQIPEVLGRNCISCQSYRHYLFLRHCNIYYYPLDHHYYLDYYIVIPLLLLLHHYYTL